jgi:hypothetical protein
MKNVLFLMLCLPAAGPLLAQGSFPVPSMNRSDTARMNAQDQGLGGRVTIEGAAPGYPVEVRIMCAGKLSLRALTDTKGNFSLNLPRQNGPATVRSEESLNSVNALADCIAEGVLLGQRSDQIKIRNRSFVDGSNLGTIVLHRSEDAEGTMISSTGAAAPKDARKAFEKAFAELTEQKLDPAEKDLQKTVQLYPAYADAWFELGNLQARKNPGAARNSYLQAVAADPKFVRPYQGLMQLAASQEKWPEVLDYAGTVLKLIPHGNPEALYLQATASYRSGQKDVAESAARRGIQEDPVHSIPELEQLLGVILFGKQDNAGALEHLQNYLKFGGKDKEVAQQSIAAVQQAIAASK